MKKKRITEKKTEEKQPTLKDLLNEDLLQKLNKQKEMLKQEEEQKKQLEEERKREERRQREKNKSFEELLKESDLDWKKFK